MIFSFISLAERSSGHWAFRPELTMANSRKNNGRERCTVGKNLALRKGNLVTNNARSRVKEFATRM